MSDVVIQQGRVDFTLTIDAVVQFAKSAAVEFEHAPGDSDERTHADSRCAALGHLLLAELGARPIFASGGICPAVFIGESCEDGKRIVGPHRALLHRLGWQPLWPVGTESLCMGYVR